MELPKKICSFGIFDINLNLELSQKEASEHNFNINKYNYIEDLKNIFYPRNNSINDNEFNFDILNHISLTSDNNLINSLLFINKANKYKSFVEFIMFNQLKFSKKTKFIHELIKYVLDKNYFYIIENKICDIPSSIKFIIKIFKDNSNEILHIKKFELFEMNDIEINVNEIDNKIINKNILNSELKKNIFKEINYNYSKTDFFIIDLEAINNILNIYNYNSFDYYVDFIFFLNQIIEQNKSIKIITIISKNIFDNIQLSNNLANFKDIIDLSDIIFSFKDTLNYFFKEINSKQDEIKNSIIYSKNKNKNKNKNNKVSGKLNMNKNDNFKKDLILDDLEKIRKNIPRISILFNEFNYISIYIQSGSNMKLDYIEIFFLKNNNNNTRLGNKYFYYFIGGFLSRFLYNKSFKLSCFAGQLLINKIIKLNSFKFINVDDYNIIVPKRKKILNLKLKSKENSFEFNFQDNKFNNNNSFYNYNFKDYLNNNVKQLRKLKLANSIILKENNSEKFIKLKKNNLFYKTSNFKKNNSMINIKEKDKIRENKNRILSMISIGSTSNIHYDKKYNLKKSISKNINNINNFNPIKKKKKYKISLFKYRNKDNIFNNKFFSSGYLVNDNK